MNVFKKIVIQKGTTDHIDQLANLFNKYRIFYGKESDIDGAKFFLLERLTKNESEIFVSFHDTVITGFTQLYPLFSSTRMKRIWLLNDLFVEAGFRGQGFSMALLQRAMELCRQTQACGLMLETAKTNEVANRLYQKMGLELDKEHNVYNWDVK
jgi:GNAT superfamily N-acetyltransferase